MNRLGKALLRLSMILWIGAYGTSNAQTFDDLMNSVQPRPPGTSFSVSVVRDGATRYLGSRGNPGPAGAGDRYMLASVTKQFTAAAILALEKDGRLDLSNSAARFLRALPHWNQITIRDLLNHQTTLPDYVSAMPYSGGAALQSSISLSALLNIIAGVSGTPQATGCIAYSNSNYAALASIIETASGQSFGSYLNSKIFGPLEMTQTSYTGNVLGNVRRGHFANGAPTGDYQSSWANGAGGIVTTARDMAKWNVAIMDGFLDIADRAKDDVVTGSCRPLGVSSYAYGWIVGPNGVLEHSGVVEGYSTYNLIDVDRGVAVTVLSNFAGYKDGIAAFARSLARAGGRGGSTPARANYCCTQAGRYGPGENPDGRAGLRCTWLTPWGWQMGQTCP